MKRNTFRQLLEQAEQAVIKRIGIKEFVKRQDWFEKENEKTELSKEEDN